MKYFYETKGLYGRTVAMGMASSYDEARALAEAGADTYLEPWWLARTAFMTIRTLGGKGFMEESWQRSN